MCSTDHVDIAGHQTLALADASCSCSTHTGHEGDVRHDERPTQAGVNTDFLVEGMTCSHCVASVTEEISAIDGVEAVSVDLNPGGVSRVTVASAAPVSDASIRAAVDEAGYTLAGRPS